MGGKTTTSTNQVTIPQDVLDRYNAVNTQAAKVAENPFQKYGTTAEDFVAQFNNQQLAGVSDINAASGAYKPYMTEATSATQSGISSINDVIGDYKPYMTEARSATRSGMGPAYEGIDNYMSPYIKDVADTTRAQMEQAQEQAQSGALGTAVSSGAFGGDRAGVAAANLANQQNLAMGSTMANIYNQGYTQALGASQADLARQLQGGSQIASIGAQSQQLGLQGAQAQLAAGTQMADLGARAQQLGLQGGQAQLAAGTQMQQTEQAGKDALINQFMQEQGYPFQVAQFLANIAMGTGALSGSTTTTTQPAQILSDRRLKHDIKKIGEADNGLPIYTFKYKGDDHHQTHVGFMADEVERKNPDAVGLDPSGYKTVDYDKAAQSMGGGVHPHHKGEAFADGGVAGPYGSKVGQGVGVGSYVPQAFLPVGELMVADPAVAAQHKSGIADALESAASMGKSVVEIRDLLKKEARGGVVGGYADGGGVVPKLHGDYLSSTLAAQEAGKDKPELMTAKPAEKQESALGNIASTLGSIATIAKIIPFSDRRLKHDIKRIGKTEKGLPIYTFKYKGDDREQTHVGFMADEVERDHPEAVGRRDGYKTVDYSQAHKFATGGVAGRHGYALDGAVEERIRDAMRKAAAAENDMRMARDEGAARDVDNSYRKMPAIFSDEATRIMADREGKGLGEYLSSLGQEAMSAKFADAERRAANQITSSNSVFNENLPVRGTQTGSNDISSKFDRVRDEALLGLGANASQAFTDADYYGLGADQGMPDLLTARQTFTQENPLAMPSEGGPNDFRATPARPSIFDEIGGTVGDIAQNYREAALREARKASMGSTASMPPPEMTGPEYLASLEVIPTGVSAVQEVGTRIGDALEFPARLGLGAASQIGGLGAGLLGFPETGNQMVDFARDQFGNAALAAQDLVGSAEDRENRAANRAIAAAPLTVDQRPKPRPVEGGVAAGAPGVEDESARFYRMAAANRFNAENAAPTGVVPVSAPVDGQMRPKPRPEGLGAAAAPVAAPVVPAKPAVDTGRKIASVIGSGDGFTDVMYTDGTKDRVTGNLNFRNNNPGNMEYGDLAKKYGAVGTDGRFAVFPDYETGRKAQEALLFESGVYEGKTIGSAIAKYAPFGDGNNDPVAYANNVAAALGVPVDTPLSALNPEQRNAMLTAMEKQEGGGGLSTFSTTPLGADGSPVPLRGGVAGGAGSQGRRGGVKPYEERNALGRVLYDEDGRLNKNAMLSLFAGLGDMLSSPSPFLLPAIGAGVAGAAKTYMAREGQLADIAKTQAETARTNIIANSERYFRIGADGLEMVTLLNGDTVTLGEYLGNENLRASENPQTESIIRDIAAEKASNAEGTIFSTPLVKGYIEKETANYSMNPAAAKARTDEIMTVARTGSENARASLPALMLQTNAISGLDSSGVFQKYRTAAIRVANDILRMAGQEELSSSATDAEIATKAAIIRSLEMAGGSNQNSAQALDLVLQSNANASYEPLTNAKIMASTLLANQRAIDLNSYLSEYQDADGNDFRTVNSGGVSSFGEAYQRQYMAEEKALEKIVYGGSNPIGDGGYTILQLLSGTELNSQQKNNIAVQYLRNNGMSEAEIENLGDISRYFGG